MVEDDAQDAALAEREVRRADVVCTFRRVDTRDSMVEALREFVPDVILTDHSLPGFGAREALQLAQQLSPGTPVIVVTGMLGDEPAVQYMQAGATDYVVKDHLRRLGPAVLRALDTKRSREAQARAQQLQAATYRIAQVAMSTPGLRELLPVIHQIVGELMPAKNLYIALYDPASERLSFPYFADEREPAPPPRRLGKGLTEYVLRTGQPLLMTAELHRDLERRGEVELIGAPSIDWIGVPLAAGGRVIGVLAAQSYSPEVRLGEREKDILQFVSTQVAMAIERSHAEAELRASEATYRSLVEDSPFGIFRSTPDGQLLAVNPALVSILGYDSEEELLHKNMAADVYVDPAQRARLLDEVLMLDSLTGESLWRRKDAKTITVRHTARVVRDAEGRVEYFNVLVEDITEHKLLEAQLRQAQKMEAVGRLAGGIAHDFNNLLTAILGSADLLLDTLSPDAPEREDLDEIRKAAKRAADLTRQLLAFSRQQLLAPQVLDVNALLTNLEKLLRRLIGEHIELRTALAPNVGAVQADPGQLEQVIVNLAVNARDAMPQGGQLTIETANAELDEAYAAEHFPARPGSYVLLAVTDTGTGMDAQTKSHIFEPFFTTKEKGKGTGLGLATVYGIVKQSDGYIWVYSEPGHGTSFKIYLPRVAEAPGPARPGFELSASVRGSETVFVVEDDEMVRALIRRMLETRGYTVLLAPHGDEALQLLERHPGRVDLLMTDVVMPGMSGRDLADRVAERRPGIKVLYLSGYTDDAIVRHGVLEPGIAFLQKPFSADALARKVREVLDSPRQPT